MIQGIEITEIGNFYFAKLGNLNLGRVLFDPNKMMIISLWVQPRYQRQGVATAIYNFIEDKYKKNIVSNPNSSEVAQLFKKAYDAGRLVQK